MKGESGASRSSLTTVASDATVPRWRDTKVDDSSPFSLSGSRSLARDPLLSPASERAAAGHEHPWRGRSVRGMSRRNLVLPKGGMRHHGLEMEPDLEWSGWGGE
jgi:hypothetical protein